MKTNCVDFKAPLVKKIQDKNFLINFSNGSFCYNLDDGFILTNKYEGNFEPINSEDKYFLDRLRCFPSIDEVSLITAKNSKNNLESFFVTTDFKIEDNFYPVGNHIILQKNLNDYDYYPKSCFSFLSDLEYFLFNKKLNDFKVFRGEKCITSYLKKSKNDELLFCLK